jgi:hypothetical protein
MITLFLMTSRGTDSLKDYASVWMNPMLGFVPIVLITPIIANIFFKTSIHLQIIESFVLMVILYFIYFFSALIFAIVHKLPRITFILLGFILYVSGTWLMQY